MDMIMQEKHKIQYRLVDYEISIYTIYLRIINN